MDVVLTKLETILNGLESAYGQVSSLELSDPFEMILFENVAYLVSDETREAAFIALRDEIGAKPTSILAAQPDKLKQLVRPAGMANTLVARLREIALITLAEFGGDLNEVVSRPFAKAKKALMKFPSIGEPGAEKILLHANAYPVLALDSNGLRVLLRLGYGVDHKSYKATYQSAQTAAHPELDGECAAFKRAHFLLRLHGKEICKRARPRCDSCSVINLCEYFANQK